jgi:hypothetical protein
MLYHYLFHVRTREPGEPRGNTPLVFYLVVGATFLAANPAVLLPQTWAYLSAYSSESLLTHHGYLMGETLYDNVMSKTPFGATPVYFYLLFLALKVPLAILAAAAVGLCVVARRWREPGPAFLLLMFVLWIVPYSIFGAKWLRYTLSLMPLVYMLAAVGVVWLVRRGASLVKGRDGRGFAHAPAVVGALAVVVFVAAPADEPRADARGLDARDDEDRARHRRFGEHHERRAAEVAGGGRGEERARHRASRPRGRRPEERARHRGDEDRGEGRAGDRRQRAHVETATPRRARTTPPRSARRGRRAGRGRPSRASARAPGSGRSRPRCSRSSRP